LCRYRVLELDSGQKLRGVIINAPNGHAKCTVFNAKVQGALESITNMN